MSCGIPYARFYSDGWRIPPERQVDTTPQPIEGLTVESFLIKYPEFCPQLEDPDLGEDYLDRTMLRAAIEIQYGQWPEAIQSESVYLLLAHSLQRQFEQQSDTATRAIRASQGANASTSSQTNRVSVNDDLMSTVYGEQLVRLQAQTRLDGGIVV